MCRKNKRLFFACAQFGDVQLAEYQKKLALWGVLCGALAWSIVEPPFVNGFTVFQLRNPTVIEQNIDAEDWVRVVGDLVVERWCDMVSSVHRAGLPETGSSTAQRSCHRFKDGRQDASASIARRP